QKLVSFWSGGDDCMPFVRLLVSLQQSFFSSRPARPRNCTSYWLAQRGTACATARCFMSQESRRLAGILLVIFLTVVFGGTSLLTLLGGDPRYMNNPLRQDLWRAGHAHAGVLLVLSLLVLRYVDEIQLSDRFKRFVRYAIPTAAILLPMAFFLSVLSSDA